MIYDAENANTPSLLRDTYDVTSWNPEIMFVVEVHAQAITHDVHEMDKHVSGVYHIALPLTLGNASAGAALDVFHSSVSVKSLDDFQFTVFDCSGQELTEQDDYESYSHSSSGYLIRKS